MLDFSLLPVYAGYLFLMAAITEACTEVIKSILPENIAARLGETDKRLMALIVSIVLFIVAPLPNVHIVVNLIVAVVVSRGANFVHDFLKIVRQLASKQTEDPENPEPLENAEN